MHLIEAKLLFCHSTRFFPDLTLVSVAVGTKVSRFMVWQESCEREFASRPSVHGGSWGFVGASISKNIVRQVVVELWRTFWVRLVEPFGSHTDRTTMHVFFMTAPNPKQTG